MFKIWVWRLKRLCEIWYQILLTSNKFLKLFEAEIRNSLPVLNLAYNQIPTILLENRFLQTIHQQLVFYWLSRHFYQVPTKTKKNEQEKKLFQLIKNRKIVFKLQIIVTNWKISPSHHLHNSEANSCLVLKSTKNFRRISATMDWNY